MRSYDQFCGLAQALDRVGGRWTLLIVRELLPGPARFEELRRCVGGAPSNLLADRLRELTDAGIVTKRDMVAPAVAVYDLTDTGRALEPAVLELARWGMRYMPQATYTEPGPRGCWFAARALLLPEAASGVTASVAFDLPDEAVVTVALDDGEIRVVLGEVETPAARVAVAPAGFLAFMAGVQDAEHVSGRRADATALWRVAVRSAELRSERPAVRA